MFFFLYSIILKKSTFTTFIDLQKAFNMVDRKLMDFSLLKNRVDGQFYQTLKSVYFDTESCERLCDHYTDSLFECRSGVRKGYDLSPTFFADLAMQLKHLNNGIQIGPNTLNSFCTQTI